MCNAGWLLRFAYLLSGPIDRPVRKFAYEKHLFYCETCAAYFAALDAAATVVPHEEANA